MDVENSLKAMSYQAPGENGIHNIQLVVSASLAARGEDMDVIVDTLMRATRAAAGRDGVHWNWAREEANIRRMTETACAKFADSRNRALMAKSMESETVVLKNAASGGGEVIDLTKERHARSPQKQVTDSPSNRNDHVIVQGGPDRPGGPGGEGRAAHAPGCGYVRLRPHHGSVAPLTAETKNACAHSSRRQSMCSARIRRTR